MNIQIFVLTMFPSLLCLVIAWYLAAKKLDGWGWFIFAALLLTHLVRFTGDPECEAAPAVPTEAGGVT